MALMLSKPSIDYSTGLVAELYYHTKDPIVGPISVPSISWPIVFHISI